MKRQEVTSKRVAAIAGRVLRRTEGFLQGAKLYVANNDKLICTVAELKALAASALTQAPDRKAK